MAISFRCQKCNQRLSAAERKVGQQVRCPKCKTPITIPSKSSTAKSAVGPDADNRTESKPDAAATNDPTANNPTKNDTAPADELDAFSDLMVYDQAPVEIDDSFDAVDPSAQSFDAASSPQPTDATLVAVSRRTLYLQGVIIATATIGAFVIGFLIGAATSSDPPSLENAPPVTITGHLTYENSAGEIVGDSRSVVIALPVGLSLLAEEKLVVDDLSPLAEAPQIDNPVWASIDAMGGFYGRTGDDGAFRMILAPGKYHVLYVSRHAERANVADLPKRHLAEMGSYFQGTLDLIGDQQFIWSKQEFDDDAYLSHQF